MKPDITDLIFLVSTVLAAIGLAIIIYSRNNEQKNNRLFILTLLLVVGYIVSHVIHFLVMTTGDVTILDRSCHSFLLLINITLTFFAWNFPDERRTGYLKASFILVPSVAVLAMLWNGLLVGDSMAHHMHFEPHFTDLYPVYLLWYTFLILLSSAILLRRLKKEKHSRIRMQIVLFLSGLVITNLISFLFGIFIPWVLGFYYLVEVSPLAFLIGVIAFTLIAIGKFDMFPKASDRVRAFSINRKVMLIALVLVPIIIMLIQVPLGRTLLGIRNEDWLKYFAVSMAGGLLVSISMAVLINLIISYPLRELKNTALGIQQGNYSVRSSVASNDELGEVAEAFNEMAITLDRNSGELKAREHRIAMLLNAFEKSRVAIAIVDTSGVIVEANTTFASFLDRPVHEVLGCDIIELQFPESRDAVPQEIKNGLMNRTNYECEFSFTNKNSVIRNMLLTMSPVFTKDNDIAGYMFVEVDITERKNLEKKLLQAGKLAALGEMSAVLAHEIKTPLTSIKMNADILSEGLVLTDEDRESFQIIQKEIRRLDNLVKDVLSISRQQKLNYSSVDISELIGDVIIQFRAKSASKNIDLINNVAAETVIMADAGKLRQVLINLFENSFDAMGSSGQISVSSEICGAMLHIYISDNGPGVSVPERIFDPFVTTKAAGTGLGLAVSRKIVEQHGGTLKLITAAGSVGSTFEISLPVG
ncbi:MAG: ATP-binding protein [Bacteroidota bacterium]